MDKRGSPIILEFLKSFRDRQTQAQAFKSVLGVTEKEFDAQFAVWARSQIKSWGFSDEPIYELKEIERKVKEKAGDFSLVAHLAESQYLDIERRIRMNPEDYDTK